MNIGYTTWFGMITEIRKNGKVGGVQFAQAIQWIEWNEWELTTASHQSGISLHINSNPEMVLESKYYYLHF